MPKSPDPSPGSSSSALSAGTGNCEQLLENELYAKLTVGFTAALMLFLLAAQLTAETTAGDAPKVFGNICLAIFPCASVSLLIWLYRAGSNAEWMKRAPLRIRPWMSVAGFFLPYACMVLPCISLMEIASVSFAHRPRRNVFWLVMPWWLSLWAGGGLLMVALWGFRSEEMIRISLASLSISWVFLYLIVRRITDVQAQSVAGTSASADTGFLPLSQLKSSPSGKPD